MAEHPRVSVEIDDTKIWAVDAHYVTSRGRNKTGLRVGDTTKATGYFYADIHDTKRNTPDNTVKLWKLATEKDDPKHKVVFTYYDAGGKVINTAKFQGWVSTFHTFTPATDGGGAGPGAPSLAGVGLALFCEMTAVLDEENDSKHLFDR